ncbi:dihydroorotate dehydrogenase (quinone), mitochondrial-like isoform X2 [Thrips palmi]|uniref:Dihydroorotate dehydrogenase (quinone), mitochondrial n=1 Tax=Thrips palmi TaxID=161013 RepID=A0A6P9A9A3_THRPL|nr:dihydroorotate dehydrogenase (quinone), mitochondrial-like isoform X2 [Thrips palmi]
MPAARAVHLSASTDAAGPELSIFESLRMKKGVKHLISMAAVCSGGTCVYAGYNIFRGNEKFYDNILIPLLHCLNPETAHNFAVQASKFKLIPHSHFKDPECLTTNVWNIKFANPVGMAAGFDKQGGAVEGLLQVGFGFVEIGSVTPMPQPGNPQPRVFRLPEDSAVINRYGFNSDGHVAVHQRLKNLRENGTDGIIGVNLGKNKTSSDPVQDYVDGIKMFGDVADYLVINVSSPNTPGLRNWQNSSQLQELLTALVSARNELPQLIKPPLLLKLAPDLTQQERKDIARVISRKECAVDGLIISNTTVSRENLQSPAAGEQGGLSGKPLAVSSTSLIKDMFVLTKGEVPIVGVGGIFTGKDAYEKIRAGASLVQFYTAYIYHGPPRITKIKQELSHLLSADGYTNVAEAVGKDVEV